MAAGYSVGQAMALVILFQLLLVIVSLLVLLMENSSCLQGLFQNSETEAQKQEQENSTQ
jgi:predicted metalloprotease